ncbi:PopZ family protein [Mesorhizobium sp. CAU 1741]|uniref:PopZ family protein n=1 Tax=Mesorhizobium sp. CAU 1741 TaxID=3140366 RepID=UPI00325B26F5
MAQTGSAQREPSMEEILASIRRIIEDSDAVRSPLDDESHAEVEVAGVTHEQASDPFGDVEAFRTDMDEPEALSSEAAPTAGFLDEPTAEPEQSAPMAEIHPLRREPDPVGPSGFAGHDEHVAEPSYPSAPEHSLPDEAERADEAHEAAGDIRPAIISDQTSRQVAAAFGELSEAFAASRKRSFDDMAEEMLRPMLQDWLDNNLPTLVEKLVREEIERVARGG